MTQDPFSNGDFFKNLWRNLESEFWLTMASQAPTRALRGAYLQRLFYATTTP